MVDSARLSLGRVIPLLFGLALPLSCVACHSSGHDAGFASAARISQESLASQKLEAAALRHVGDYDVRLRRAAVELLRRLNPTCHQDVLIDALSDVDHGVLYHAIQGLADAGCMGAVPGIIEYATDTHAVGPRAVLALGKLGGPLATRHLESLMSSRNSTIARFAAEALATHDEDWIPESISRVIKLRGPRWSSVFAVALSHCARPKDVGLLRTLLVDSGPMARYYVVRALASLGEIDESELMDQRSNRVDKEEWLPIAEYHRGTMNTLYEYRCTEVMAPEIMAAMVDADIVIMAEAHGRSGILDLQIKIAKHLARHWGESLLGYEPPSRSTQQPIIDCSESLGWRTVPLEKSDDSSGRSQAVRDEEILNSITACVTKNPRKRMLIAYGRDHVIGAGRLHAKLAHMRRVTIIMHAPILYWTVVRGTGNLDLTGRMYRVAKDVYYWPGHPPIHGLGADPLAPTEFKVDEELIGRLLSIENTKDR